MATPEKIDSKLEETPESETVVGGKTETETVVEGKTETETVVEEMKEKVKKKVREKVEPRMMRGEVVAKSTYAPYQPGRGRGRGGLSMSVSQQARARYNKRQMAAAQARVASDRDAVYRPHREAFAAVQHDKIVYTASAGKHRDDLPDLDFETIISSADPASVDFGTNPERSDKEIIFRIQFGGGNVILGHMDPLTVFHIGPTGGGLFQPLH